MVGMSEKLNTLMNLDTMIMRTHRSLAAHAAWLVMILALAACGGGSGSTPMLEAQDPPQT